MPQSKTPTKEAPALAPFNGFSPQAFAFFKGLERNNNREWFAERKALFEGTCRDTFQALTIALDPPHGAARISRIYRDVVQALAAAPCRTNRLRVSAGAATAAIAAIAAPPFDRAAQSALMPARTTISFQTFCCCAI